MGVPVLYLLRRLPYGSSILPSIVLCSDGQPSDDGIRELAAPRWNSLTITRQLVVSYTTFSPLPIFNQSMAVVFFYQYLLSPIASIFGSGAPCAARTFLSCLFTSDRTRTLLSACKINKKMWMGNILFDE